VSSSTHLLMREWKNLPLEPYPVRTPGHLGINLPKENHAFKAVLVQGLISLLRQRLTTKIYPPQIRKVPIQIFLARWGSQLDSPTNQILTSATPPRHHGCHVGTICHHDVIFSLVYKGRGGTACGNLELLGIRF
jgi:hypothetical protein